MTSGGPVFLVKDGAQSWPEIAPMRARIYPPEKLRNSPMHGIEWANAERRVLLYIDDMVRAVAGIYEREIFCDGQPTRVAGIGGVMTDPDYQGLGYGKQVMSHVMELLRTEANCIFALLFCEDHNIGFFRRFGWSLFVGEMRVEQHGKTGPFAFRNEMVLPLAGPAQRTGKLDLCGLPW